MGGDKNRGSVAFEKADRKTAGPGGRTKRTGRFGNSVGTLEYIAKGDKLRKKFGGIIGNSCLKVRRKKWNGPSGIGGEIVVRGGPWWERGENT